VSVAVTIAVGVNGDARREVLGMAVGPGEPSRLWTKFLRSLTRRGLRSVQLAKSDADEGRSLERALDLAALSRAHEASARPR